MNSTRFMVALALAVCGGCDDEQDKSPAPVGNSSGAPSGGNGGKGTTGGTNDGDGDGDDDDGDDGNAPPPDDDGGAWAVGQGAEMLRIDPDGSGASGYDLQGDQDLLGIACHGDRVAWAVGTAGTLLYTNDAGERWSVAATGLDTALRAVAISSAHTIITVGDEGAVLVSRDAGARFSELVAPAVDFSAVTADAAGLVAFAASDDGSIWRYDAGSPGVSQVWVGNDSLHGIAMTPGGDRIVAVGDDGRWMQSVDRGETFRAQDAATERDLHAVQLAADGRWALAVGEAGTVVVWDELGPVVQELLDDETALHAVHVSGTGHGIAVGDAGVAFTTLDAGLRWEPVGLPTTRDLFGVDEISLHGHR